MEKQTSPHYVEKKSESACNYVSLKNIFAVTNELCIKMISRRRGCFQWKSNLIPKLLISNKLPESVQSSHRHQRITLELTQHKPEQWNKSFQPDKLVACHFIPSGVYLSVYAKSKGGDAVLPDTRSPPPQQSANLWERLFLCFSEEQSHQVAAQPVCSSPVAQNLTQHGHIRARAKRKHTHTHT